MPDFPVLPEISHENLSVILLAHNDAPFLERVVNTWSTHLNTLAREFELFLVDCGSHDETQSVASQLAEKSPKLSVVSVSNVRGEGHALRSALTQATHPLVFYTRCKPCYHPAHLSRLLVEKTAQHPDQDQKKPEIDIVHLTCGFRAFHRVPAPARAIGSIARLFAKLILSLDVRPYPGWLGWKMHLTGFLRRWLFGIHNRDPFCPVRLLRKEILDRITLQSDSCFVHVELLAKANFLHHYVTQDIPIAAANKTEPDTTTDSTSAILEDAWSVFLSPTFPRATA